MSNQLDRHLLGRTRTLQNLICQLGCDVGEARAEFAGETEVRLFGEVGRHEVVGTGQVVEIGHGEGLVGSFEVFPGCVTEDGEGSGVWWRT